MGLQPAAWPSGRGRGASEPLLPPPAFRAAAASLRGLLGGGGPGEEEGGAAPPHQRELEGWVRRGYPAALDAIRQTRLCPREGRIAGRAAIAGAEALGDWLAGVGYSVELRVARGGGQAGGGRGRGEGEGALVAKNYWPALISYCIIIYLYDIV